MGSSKSSSKDTKTSTDDTTKAPEPPQEPQTAQEPPVSTSSSDNVLSTSEVQVTVAGVTETWQVQSTVGGVTVIDHFKYNGEANAEGGGA